MDCMTASEINEAPRRQPRGPKPLKRGGNVVFPLRLIHHKHVGSQYHWTQLRFHEALLRFVNFMNTNKSTIYVSHGLIEYRIMSHRLYRVLDLTNYRFAIYGLANWQAD